MENTVKKHSGPKNMNAKNIQTFRIQNEDMNSGLINDTPIGAIVTAEETELNNLISKYGFILKWKGKYYHRDIAQIDEELNQVLCTSRNSENGNMVFPIPLAEIETIYEVTNRQF